MIKNMFNAGMWVDDWIDQVKKTEEMCLYVQNNGIRSLKRSISDGKAIIQIASTENS